MRKKERGGEFKKRNIRYQKDTYVRFIQKKVDM